MQKKFGKYGAVKIRPKLELRPETSPFDLDSMSAAEQERFRGKDIVITSLNVQHIEFIIPGVHLVSL